MFSKCSSANEEMPSEILPLKVLTPRLRLSVNLFLALSSNELSLIADVTAHCLQSLNVNAGLSGIYNLVPSGQTSWYDYALYAINIARDLGAPIKVSNESLLAIPTEECKTQAKRPLNSCLDTGKIQTIFNIELPSWEKGVNSTVLRLV